MLGLSLLVVVSAVGLTQLAVRRPSVEHLLGMAVVLGIAFPLLFVAPVAAVLLLMAAESTRRLAVRAGAGVVVPDTLPSNWA